MGSVATRIEELRPKNHTKVDPEVLRPQAWKEKRINSAKKPRYNPGVDHHPQMKKLPLYASSQV